jgi:PAS domain S-box-containing protein
MSLSTNPELANLIVRTIKAYAILVLSPEGTIVDWLGDAEAVTGYEREEAIGQNFGLLFTEPDRAAGVTQVEIDVALREGRAEDSRWHLRKDGERFWANGLTVRLDASEVVLVKIFRDETPAKRAEEQRALLLNELNHRVKNTLATIQSVVEQTLRASAISADLRDDLAGRIMALARAHNVLVDQSWAGADLDVLVRDVAKPYERDPSPFVFDGPRVRLHPSQAVTLSLALHELATNAAKYGALSTARGSVTLSWNLAHNGDGERYLTLLWKEAGGPPVAEPTRSGFGSRLIQQTFGDQDGGRARLAFPSEGVNCVMTLRLIDADQADGASAVSAVSASTSDAIYEQERP